MPLPQMALTPDEVRRDRVRLFAERVDEIAGRVDGLARVGDALHADRISRVLPRGERQIVRRDGDRKPRVLGAART